MMKPIMKAGKILLVWSVIVLPCSVHAQSEEKSESAPEVAKDAKPTSRGTRNVAKGKNAELKKLQLTMYKTMDLDRNQKKAIDGHFRDYYSQTAWQRPATTRSASTGQNAARRMRSSKDPQSGKRVSEFKKSGAQKKGRKATQKSRNSRGYLTQEELLDHVEKELNADQKEAFSKLVKKLDIDRLTADDDVSLNDLSSAVRTASLRLSNQQRATVNQILDEGMAAQAQAQRQGDQKAAEQVAKRTREAVFAELSKAQVYKLKQAILSRADDPQNKATEEPTADDDAPEDDDDDDGEPD